VKPAASRRRPSNRDEHLSRWRLAILRVVDPIEWFMRKDEGPPFGRSGRHLVQSPVTYGRMGYDDQSVVPPPVPRPARETEEDFDRRRVALMAEFRSYLEASARECLEGREVVLVTTAGRITVRLVRFRNGAVLQHRNVGPHSRGHGMIRIEADGLGVRAMAEELALLVIELGPEARLLP
jgi:hypothetical protein